MRTHYMPLQWLSNESKPPVKKCTLWYRVSIQTALWQKGSVCGASYTSLGRWGESLFCKRCLSPGTVCFLPGQTKICVLHTAAVVGLILYCWALTPHLTNYTNTHASDGFMCVGRLSVCMYACLCTWAGAGLGTAPCWAWRFGNAV